MQKLAVSCLVGCSMFMTSVAQALDVTQPDQAGRIANWMILGTFGHGGCFQPLDSVIDPAATAPCVGDEAAGRIWTPYVPRELSGDWVTQGPENAACNFGRVSADLNFHFGGTVAGDPSFVMAYAFTYLVVDQDMDVIIGSGSDDGYKYWIDGALVLDGSNACRCYADDQEDVSVTLTAGIHRILVQVGESGGHWGFVMRFKDTTDEPIISGISATLDTDCDGILDYEDACPESDLAPTVIIGGCDSGVTNTLFPDGCTVSDLLAKCAVGVANHGRFVSCVAELTNSLVAEGVITGEEKGAIQSCAAQSSIGK